MKRNECDDQDEDGGYVNIIYIGHDGEDDDYDYVDRAFDDDDDDDNDNEDEDENKLNEPIVVLVRTR